MEINSLSQSYSDLIEEIIEAYNQNKIRSKEQIYQTLVQGINKGTGEIFERCLNEKIATIKTRLETERKKLKLTRILKFLETIEQQWQRWLQENQTQDKINDYAQLIVNSEPENRLLTFLKIIDPNQNNNLSKNELKQLSKNLKLANSSTDVQQLSDGIVDGLNSFKLLEPHLTTWLYETNKSSLGFEREKENPWHFWSKKIENSLLKQVLEILGENSLTTQQIFHKLGEILTHSELRFWVELIITIQSLEKGLIVWFDQQPYNIKLGKKLSYGTLLDFAFIWFQVSKEIGKNSYKFSECCFQISLQNLRTFAQRDDFPLYSGVFASFSGKSLQNALQYFNEPLKQIERTQEKARLLTLLGYSQRILGNYQQANLFHQEALQIANEANDKPCEIANLNHLARTYVKQKNYQEAINFSQRALILAREIGDRLGQANSLISLGYGQVFSYSELEIIDNKKYEESINYLQEGLNLAQKLSDYQSQSFAYNSLGIAYFISSQPATAITNLLKGLELAFSSGDVYLQGLNYTYLAESHYALGQEEKAIYYSCLGMYLLDTIGTNEWRKNAGLLSILKGKIGDDSFQNLLGKYRADFIKIIGVDGYDYLPTLLVKYRQT